MELFKKQTNYDFVSKIPITVSVSILLCIATLILWFVKGPNLGLDFLGGTEIEITFLQGVSIDKVRAALSQLNVGGTEVKSVGGEKGAGQKYLIRVEKKVLSVKDTSGQEVDVGEAVVKGLKEKIGPYDEKSVGINLVGPRAGEDLRRKATIAVVFSLVAMLIYIWVRFEVLFGIGAMLSLAHDVIVTIGFLVLTGRQFSLVTIAALLTIVGYSINDTIVIYDRIREDRGKFKSMKIGELINLATNECLGRTILTTFTVFIVVVVLSIVTRGAIQDFAYAMLIGSITGVYSTVFIASAFVLFWRNRVEPALKALKKKQARA